MLVFLACPFFPGQKHMLEWWYHKGKEPGKPRSPEKVSYDEEVNLCWLLLPELWHQRYTACSRVTFTCTECLYFGKTIRSLRGKSFYKKTQSFFSCTQRLLTALLIVSSASLHTLPNLIFSFFLLRMKKPLCVCLPQMSLVSHVFHSSSR